MSYRPFPGPVPGYNPFPNPLIDFPPQAYTVSDITSLDQFTTRITTSEANGYLNGLIVQIFVPYPFKTSVFKDKYYPITVLSDTEFTIPADLTAVGNLSVSPNQSVQVIPAAEVNKYLSSASNVVGPNNPL